MVDAVTKALGLAGLSPGGCRGSTECWGSLAGSWVLYNCMTGQGHDATPQGLLGSDPAAANPMSWWKRRHGARNAPSSPFAARDAGRT